MGGHAVQVYQRVPPPALVGFSQTLGAKAKNMNSIFAAWEDNEIIVLAIRGNTDLVHNIVVTIGDQP